MAQRIRIFFFILLLFTLGPREKIDLNFLQPVHIILKKFIMSLYIVSVTSNITVTIVEEVPLTGLKTFMGFVYSFTKLFAYDHE